MQFETQELDERLDAAITELRNARVDERMLAKAETQVLRRFRSHRVRHSVVLAFAATGGLAALFGAVAVMTPSESVAAQLERIAHNGDHGLRHVVQFRIQPDGSHGKGVEYFANDNQVRVIYRSVNNQIVFTRKTATHFYPEGAATIERFQGSWTRELFDFTGFSAKLIFQLSRGSNKVKESVEHGVVVDGRTVDRFTSECEIQSGAGSTQHGRLILLADPQTQSPIRQESFVNGKPVTITTWDFPTDDPSLVEGPKVDPNRVYNLDDEREQILSAMVPKGQTRIVHGHKLEFKTLVIDEHGNADAIVLDDEPYPGNYEVRINGQVDGDAKQTEAEAKRYMISRPFHYRGKSYQTFLGTRSFAKPDIHWPKRVRLEIPVVEGLRLVGYAKFDDVLPVRCWNENQLLRPQSRYFWENDILPEPQATRAVPVKG